MEGHLESGQRTEFHLKVNGMNRINFNTREIITEQIQEMSMVLVTHARIMILDLPSRLLSTYSSAIRHAGREVQPAQPRYGISKRAQIQDLSRGKDRTTSEPTFKLVLAAQIIGNYTREVRLSSDLEVTRER